VLTRAQTAELEGRSGEAARLRDRAKRLFLRARDYGLRGLEQRHEGVREKLLGVRDAKAALAKLERRDVPMAYWTAAAWALAVSSGKEDIGLVAELPVPGALVSRALELDDGWEHGTLHEFMVSDAAANGDVAAAREHHRRAVELGMNNKLGPHVSLAEAVLVPAQDREGFQKVLDDVLAFDVDAPDARPWRLANILAQRRARELVAHADDLFL
jgi:hypothetical protein